MMMIFDFDDDGGRNLSQRTKSQQTKSQMMCWDFVRLIIIIIIIYPHEWGMFFLHIFNNKHQLQLYFVNFLSRIFFSKNVKLSFSFFSHLNLPHENTIPKTRNSRVDTLQCIGCTCKLQIVKLFSAVYFKICPQMVCPRGCIVTLVAFVGIYSTVCFQKSVEMACLRGCKVTFFAVV